LAANSPQVPPLSTVTARARSTADAPDEVSTSRKSSTLVAMALKKQRPLERFRILPPAD
jgi:hypothetical protein